MSSEIAIQAVHLSKEYRIYSNPKKRLLELLYGGKRQFHKRFKAVQPISFEIAKGTTLGIVGRNGSGKSTLLQMMAGTLTPTTGSIEVKGRIAALLELGSGFNPEFTGRENVHLYGSIMQMSRAEINERIDEVLAFADIGSFIDQPIKTYSSGMHVRLAFSAAIHIDPDVLLIDEALAVGDPAFQLKCFEKLNSFKQRRKTIVFVSHDVNAVTQFCDRVLVLSNGELIFTGKPLDAMNIYKAVLFAGAKTSLEQSSKQRGRNQERVVFNEQETRFGNQEAEIYAVNVFNKDGEVQQVFLSNEQLSIVFKVRSHLLVKEPVYGIRIKNRQGLQAYVVNSLHQQFVCPALDAGASQKITFHLKLHLASNDYFLTVGVSEYRNGELTVLDRRNDLIQFKVIGAEGLGIANLEAEIAVELGDECTPED